MTAWGYAWGPAWGFSWGAFAERAWSVPLYHTAFDILNRNIVTVRGRSVTATYVFWEAGAGVLSVDRSVSDRRVSLSRWSPGFVLIP